MPERPRPAKATIVSAADSSKKVECHFNPDQLTVTKMVQWVEKPDIGGDAAELSFGGGKAQELSISLLFDTTATGTDVRNSYRTLFEMALVDKDRKNAKTGQGSPPMCIFTWGRFISFTAVITRITQKFIMFKSDGTPVRAEVTVSFKQVDTPPGAQNPTSRSEARRIWVVTEGETLDWIAYKEYGDPAAWRHIAETNDLDDPMDLHSGQVLRLVPLP